MKKFVLMTLIVLSQFIIGGSIRSTGAISPVDYANLIQARGEWAEIVNHILDENFEEAARLAKSVSSNASELVFLKGFLAHREGNPEIALEEFRKIQEHFASLRELIVFYEALCYNDLKDFDKANDLLYQNLREYQDSGLTSIYQQTLIDNLIASERYQEALKLIESITPKASPFHLWLQQTEAKIYEQIDQPENAFNIYLDLWINYPLDDVGRTDHDWRRLVPRVGKQPKVEQYFQRIEKIIKKGQYDRALEELQVLKDNYSNLSRSLEQRWYLLKGECHYLFRQNEIAIEYLRKIEESSLLPEALYYLQLTYFRKTEQPEYAELFEQTADRLINYPREKSGNWREQALQKLAKHFEVDFPQDPVRSIEVSQQLIDEHPNSSYAPEAKWKIAWLYYLQGEHQEALQRLEQLDMELAKKPRGQGEFIPQVKYWKGKALEAIGKQEEAVNVYQKLNTDYTFHYYGYLSRLRLQATYPPVTIKKAFPDIYTLNDNALNEYEQFKELVLLGFYNDAETVLLHLKNAASKEAKPWLAYELSRFYAFMQKPDQAIRTIAASSDLYSNFILRQPQAPAPEEFYKIYYPELYHEWIVEETTKHTLRDPLLVHALIHHESKYNSNTISFRGAVGLLQVMPELLEQYRQESDEKDMETYDLFDPYSNIRIGCYKLGKNLKEFGHLIPALLSYNADITKVRQWLPYTPDGSFDVYIEQIPFIETQNFFKRVYETYCDYLRIYGGMGNMLN